MADTGGSVALDVELNAIRQSFPAVTRALYLDAARHAPLARPVAAAVRRFLSEALLTAGPKTRWLATAETVRERLARLMGAVPSSVVFTKNASEGLNQAAQAIPMGPGDNVVLFRGEHPNNAAAFLNLSRRGIEVRQVVREAGRDDVQTLRPHMDGRTRAVSISHVAYDDGRRADIAVLGDACRAMAVHLVVDATQSIGVTPVEVSEGAPSVVAFSCNKGLLGVPGLGAMYVAPWASDLRPSWLATAGLAQAPADLVLTAADMQPRPDAARFAMGLSNLPAIYALGAALDLIERVGVVAISAHVLALGERLIGRLRDLDVGLIGAADPAHRANIYLLDLPAEGWDAHFGARGVRFSREATGARMAFGIFSNARDVDRLASIIAAGLKAGLPRGGPARRPSPRPHNADAQGARTSNG